MSLPTKTLGKDQGMEPETPNPWIDFHIKTVNNSVNATKKANSSNDETSPDVYYYRQRRQEKTREWNRRLQTHESTSTLKPSTIRQSRDNPATRWKHTLVWRNSNRCMWLPTKTLERLVNGARGSHSPHRMTRWNDEKHTLVWQSSNQRIWLPTATLERDSWTVILLIFQHHIKLGWRKQRTIGDIPRDRQSHRWYTHKIYRFLSK